MNAKLTTPDAPETTSISLNLIVDVYPQPGQSLEEAAEEMTQLLTEYLTRKESALWEDYGAEVEDIVEARETGETLVWGGYEGPFITKATVTAAEAEGEEV